MSISEMHSSLVASLESAVDVSKLVNVFNYLIGVIKDQQGKIEELTAKIEKVESETSNISTAIVDAKVEALENKLNDTILQLNGIAGQDNAILNADDISPYLQFSNSAAAAKEADRQAFRLAREAEKRINNEMEEDNRESNRRPTEKESINKVEKKSRYYDPDRPKSSEKKIKVKKDIKTDAEVDEIKTDADDVLEEDADDNTSDVDDAIEKDEEVDDVESEQIKAEKKRKALKEKEIALKKKIREKEKKEREKKTSRPRLKSKVDVTKNAPTEFNDDEDEDDDSNDKERKPSKIKEFASKPHSKEHSKGMNVEPDNKTSSQKKDEEKDIENDVDDVIVNSTAEKKSDESSTDDKVAISNDNKPEANNKSRNNSAKKGSEDSAKNDDIKVKTPPISKSNSKIKTSDNIEEGKNDKGSSSRKVSNSGIAEVTAASHPSSGRRNNGNNNDYEGEVESRDNDASEHIKSGRRKSSIRDGEQQQEEEERNSGRRRKSSKYENETNKKEEEDDAEKENINDENGDEKDDEQLRSDNEDDEEVEEEDEDTDEEKEEETSRINSGTSTPAPSSSSTTKDGKPPRPAAAKKKKIVATSKRPAKKNATISSNNNSGSNSANVSRKNSGKSSSRRRGDSSHSASRDEQDDEDDEANMIAVAAAAITAAYNPVHPIDIQAIDTAALATSDGEFLEPRQRKKTFQIKATASTSVSVNDGSTKGEEEEEEGSDAEFNDEVDDEADPAKNCRNNKNVKKSTAAAANNQKKRAQQQQPQNQKKANNNNKSRYSVSRDSSSSSLISASVLDDPTSPFGSFMTNFAHVEQAAYRTSSVHIMNNNNSNASSPSNSRFADAKARRVADALARAAAAAGGGGSGSEDEADYDLHHPLLHRRIPHHYRYHRDANLPYDRVVALAEYRGLRGDGEDRRRMNVQNLTLLSTAKRRRIVQELRRRGQFITVSRSMLEDSRKRYAKQSLKQNVDYLTAEMKRLFNRIDNVRGILKKQQLNLRNLLPVTFHETFDRLVDLLEHLEAKGGVEELLALPPAESILCYDKHGQLPAKMLELISHKIKPQITKEMDKLRARIVELSAELVTQDQLMSMLSLQAINKNEAASGDDGIADGADKGNTDPNHMKLVNMIHKCIERRNNFGTTMGGRSMTGRFKNRNGSNIAALGGEELQQLSATIVDSSREYTDERITELTSELSALQRQLAIKKDTAEEEARAMQNRIAVLEQANLYVLHLDQEMRESKRKDGEALRIMQKRLTNLPMDTVLDELKVLQLQVNDRPSTNDVANMMDSISLTFKKHLGENVVGLRSLVDQVYKQIHHKVNREDIKKLISAKLAQMEHDIIRREEEIFTVSSSVRCLSCGQAPPDPSLGSGFHGVRGQFAKSHHPTPQKNGNRPNTTSSTGGGAGSSNYTGELHLDPSSSRTTADGTASGRSRVASPPRTLLEQQQHMQNIQQQLLPVRDDEVYSLMTGTAGLRPLMQQHSPMTPINDPYGQPPHYNSNSGTGSARGAANSNAAAAKDKKKSADKIPEPLYRKAKLAAHMKELVKVTAASTQGYGFNANNPFYVLEGMAGDFNDDSSSINSASYLPPSSSQNHVQNISISSNNSSVNGIATAPSGGGNHHRQSISGPTSHIAGSNNSSSKHQSVYMPVTAHGAGGGNGFLVSASLSSLPSSHARGSGGSATNKHTDDSVTLPSISNGSQQQHNKNIDLSVKASTSKLNSFV